MLHWMVVSTQLKKNRPSKLSSQVWMETRKIWGAPKNWGWVIRTTNLCAINMLLSCWLLDTILHNIPSKPKTQHVKPCSSFLLGASGASPQTPNGSPQQSRLFVRKKKMFTYIGSPKILPPPKKNNNASGNPLKD